MAHPTSPQPSPCENPAVRRASVSARVTAETVGLAAEAVGGGDLTVGASGPSAWNIGPGPSALFSCSLLLGRCHASTTMVMMRGLRRNLLYAHRPTSRVI